MPWGGRFRKGIDCIHKEVGQRVGARRSSRSGGMMCGLVPDRQGYIPSGFFNRADIDGDVAGHYVRASACVPATPRHFAGSRTP